MSFVNAVTSGFSDNGSITLNVSFSPPPPYSEPYWIASEIVLIIVSILAVYLLACLIKFGIKTGCKPGNEIRGTKGRLLYQMLLVSVVMAVGRCISDQTVALIGWQSDIECQISVSVSFVFYSLSLYPVYIFLWLRQNIFYASPVLSSVLNPSVAIFSWAILIAMIAGGAVITVCFVLPEVTGWNYSASDTGCRDISDESDFEAIPASFAIFTILIQICLLLLFIYPLVSKKTLKYRSAKRKTPVSNGNTTPPEPQAENSSNIYTNDHDDVESNNGVLDANITNDSMAAPDETSLFKEAKCAENGGGYSNNSSILYRKQNNKDSIKENKSQKKTKSYSLTSQVKRGINWSMTSNGSYKNKRRRSSKTQQGRRVMRFIRKAFFLALICVVSDFIFTVIQLIVIERELVYLVLFDINLLINITCIILSFRNWPIMILPACPVKNSKSTSQSKNFPVPNRNKTLPTTLPISHLSPSNEKKALEKPFKNSLKYSPIKQPLENNTRSSPIKISM